MLRTNITPDNTEDLEFIVQKFQYNQYEINQENLKGILRLATVPVKILKVKGTSNEKPQFLMQSMNVWSFVNKGECGKPGKDQFSPEERQNIEKIDITDSLSVLTGPYNIYIYYNKQKTTFCNQSKVNYN